MTTHPPMPLTTIFTGHTLNLNDIVAVGPVMAGHKQTSTPFVKRTMFIEILMKGTTTIRHEGISQTYYSDMLEESQVNTWKQAFDELAAKRIELIEQWEKARSI